MTKFPSLGDNTTVPDILKMSPDAGKALKEMHRVLRDRGRLILIDVSYPADGNWLVGGDLDDSNVIDILDFGIVVRHFGRAVDSDTTCRQVGFHADINGDGTVDDSDMAFVLGHLYLQGAPGCCADGPPPAAIDEISIDELADLGLGTLSEADLNHDGLLNEDDIAVYLSSGIPTSETRKGGHNPR